MDEVLTDRRERSLKIFGQNYREKVLNPSKKFSYDDNTSGYLAGKQTVPLEELFDSNIAAFHSNGFTGGVFMQLN